MSAETDEENENPDQKTLEIHTELPADEVAARLQEAVSPEGGDQGLDGRVAGRRVRLAAVEQNQAWGPVLRARIEETDDGAVIRGKFAIPLFAWFFGLLWVIAAGWLGYAGVTVGDIGNILGAVFMVGCGVLVVVLARSSGREHIPNVRTRIETVVRT